MAPYLQLPNGFKSKYFSFYKSIVFNVAKWSQINITIVYNAFDCIVVHVNIHVKDVVHECCVTS